MIETPPQFRELLHELTSSTWSLAAVGVLFESGIVDQLKEPRSLDEIAAQHPALPRDRTAACLDVGKAVGIVTFTDDRYQLAPGVLPFLMPPMRAAIEGDIRSSLLQPLELLDSVKTGRARKGWNHTDPVVLQAQGDGSGAFPPMFKANLVGTMGDLGARLDAEGARFLDVGVGVASLSISMCRAWPGLRVVGLDVRDEPLALARENVARAGMNDRIELRKQGVQELPEDAAFDLAWLPGVFLPAAVMESAIARVRAALRPGGWVLFPVMGGGEARHRAVAALITEVWGGPVLSLEGAAELFRGFSEVRSIPAPGAWAPSMVAARR